MPTVDIPNKICPHCGGTKWYEHNGRYWCYISRTASSKSRFANRDKKIYNEKRKSTPSYASKLEKEKQKREEYRKLHPIVKPDPLTIAERSARYYARNRLNAEYKKKNVIRAQEWRLKFFDRKNSYNNQYRLINADKVKVWQKKVRKNYIDNLHDVYIKSLIVANTFFSFADIPQDLIELKRKELSVKRHLKNSTFNH